MAVGLGRPPIQPEEEVEAPAVQAPMVMPPQFPMHPAMPRRASIRETIDSPETLKGIENIYRAAQPSFGPAQKEMRYPELASPITTYGEIQGYTRGGNGSEQDSSQAQHARVSVPKGSLGLIHTHPFGIDPRPSEDDETAATRLQRPNYVISNDAMWAAEPGNKNPRKVANLKYKNGHLQYDWMNVPIPEPGK